MTTSAFAEALQLIRGLPSISSHPPLLTLYYYIIWFLFNVCGWILVILYALFPVFCSTYFFSTCSHVVPSPAAAPSHPRQQSHFKKSFSCRSGTISSVLKPADTSIPLFPFKKSSMNRVIARSNPDKRSVKESNSESYYPEVFGRVLCILWRGHNHTGFTSETWGSSWGGEKHTILSSSSSPST